MIELLRKIRKSKGLSIRKLSKISGISKTYLAKMENHPILSNPTVDKIFKLEESLRVEYGTVYLYLIESRKNINNIEIDEDQKS